MPAGADSRHSQIRPDYLNSWAARPGRGKVCRRPVSTGIRSDCPHGARSVPPCTPNGCRRPASPVRAPHAPSLPEATSPPHAPSAPRRARPHHGATGSRSSTRNQNYTWPLPKQPENRGSGDSTTASPHTPPLARNNKKPFLARRNG